MKTLINLLGTVLLICMAFTDTTAQRCDDVAFNHKTANGLLSATLRMYKTSKRLVYGNSKPTIPYSGILDHNLEELTFGGNVMVKLRKKGTKKWTKYYGMDPGVFYNSASYPWNTIEFDPLRPTWAKGDEIKVLLDDREYGFGFTESNWRGQVKMIDLPSGGYTAGNDTFKSLVVESSDRRCVMRPQTPIDYSWSTNIEPSNVLTIRIR